MNAELLAFQMNMLQAEIEMQGMIAENKECEVLERDMAYTEKDFKALIDKHSLYHNAFPSMRG